MKKFKLITLILLLMIMWSFNEFNVQASISEKEEMFIIHTALIDNLQYPATTQFQTLTGTSGIGKVVIKEPMVIKAYMSWDTQKVSQPTIWFSRDVNGIDIIGKQLTLSNTNNYLFTLLDPGTYYFNYSIKGNSSYNNSSTTYTNIGACIVGQKAFSTEKIYNSSRVNPNVITFGKNNIGFLSEIAPIDYYMFTLNEDSIVTFDFNFTKFKDVNLYDAVCTLRNTRDAVIQEFRFNTQGAEFNKHSRLLEPGTYYISMTGANTVTSLFVDKVSYKVKMKVSTTDFTKEDVGIELVIPYEYKEIMVTKGKISKSLATDYNTWTTYNQDTKRLTDKSHMISENGVYTFRIQDFLDNYTLVYVEVDNIDKDAPVIKGVVSGKTYKSKRTIKVGDSSSGIKSITLNNKKIKSGTVISKAGKYKVVAIDNAGNKTTINFVIKK